MKSNGSKFSKLIAGLVAASAIMPAMGFVSTSAMEHVEFNKAQDEYFKMKAEFCEKYPDVNGLNSDRVVETISSRIEPAMAEVAVQRWRSNPALNINDALEQACHDKNLIHSMAGLIYPTIISLPDNGGRGPDDNDPNMKLWKVLFDGSQLSTDLQKLIKDVAINYCKRQGIKF